MTHAGMSYRSPRISEPRVSTPEANGEDLLKRIRAGDEHAFGAIFEAYHTGLVRFATAHLRKPEEAEDVVHDIFLRLWDEPALLQGVRSVRTYLFTAVRNRVIDVLRRQKTRRRWLDPWSAAVVADRSRIAEVPDPSASADPTELSELDAAIRDAIAALPERCRASFLLCRDQGLSYAEAAEVMGVSPATVKTQMARALASMRTSLAPFLMCLAVGGKLLP
jgi:RNA polymerase sigma-70 factor, ECF subfamily